MARPSAARLAAGRRTQRAAPRLGLFRRADLAEAGLFDGRKATTHWADLAALGEYASIEVQGDRLHTYDPTDPQASHLFSSAGVTAGIDLALAWWKPISAALALAVAQRLVMFLRRPGGQAQFSPMLAAPSGNVARLAALLEWIPGHLGDDLSIEALAAQAHMTPRTLCRLFSQETGMGPGQYIERVRLEAARNLLLDAQASIATVARLTGFGHPENLRRSFQKHLSVSPRDFTSASADQPTSFTVPSPLGIWPGSTVPARHPKGAAHASFAQQSPGPAPVHRPGAVLVLFDDRDHLHRHRRPAPGASGSLATLPLALLMLGGLLALQPLAGLMQRRGRRAGFLIGALAGVLGGLISALSLWLDSFTLLCVGALPIGAYQASAMYYRFAALEAVSDAFKGRATACVIGGGVLAALIAPTLGHMARDLADVPFAGTYLLIASLAALGFMVLAGCRRPRESRRPRPIRQRSAGRRCSHGRPFAPRC